MMKATAEVVGAERRRRRTAQAVDGSAQIAEVGPRTSCAAAATLRPPPMPPPPCATRPFAATLR